ncbi:branchpoint-bridging protein-like [Iris pallida]|uniref:Branchpoint-bridging protein-like n=1 Tax=Iris pallida TaxID=29817 RepID=A0AAX6DMR1_IRIPA|nr:branchpoint-bridging protein-like [Iris pallida]
MEEQSTSPDIGLLQQNGDGNAVVWYKKPNEKEQICEGETIKLERCDKQTNKEYENSDEEGKSSEDGKLQQKDPTVELTEDDLSEGSMSFFSSESEEENQHWSIFLQSLADKKRRKMLRILNFANKLSMRKQWSPQMPSLPYKCDSDVGTTVTGTVSPRFANTASMVEQSDLIYLCQLDEDGSGDGRTSEKEQVYIEESRKEEKQCEKQPRKEGKLLIGTPDEKGKPSEVLMKELSEKDPSEGSITSLSSDSNDESHRGSKSALSSSEKKRRSANILDTQAKKRLKQDTCEISWKEPEKSGSSGKRKQDSRDAEIDTDSKPVGCDVAQKKRKFGRAIDDTQLKMLGPLKLPELVKGLVATTESDPQVQKLNSHLSYINRKLMSQQAIEDLADDELSPSPPPIYNDLGIRVNTRDFRLRRKLSDRRQKIISHLIQTDPTFEAPPEYKPQKLYRKLYVPVKEYPCYNFIGPIIGPHGRTHKRLEKETGARIILRGKGSCKLDRAKKYKNVKAVEDEDLHVYIEADNQESMNVAVEMVEKLLVPVEEATNKAQLRELGEVNSSTRREETPLLASNVASACSTVSTSWFGGSVPPGPTHPWTGGRRALGGASLSSCSGKAQNIDESKLFVCFLPRSVDNNRLRGLFVPFGPLCEAVVVMDKTTGSSKGYGFVKYTSPRFAAEAVTRMNGYRIDGKVLLVRVAGCPPSAANVARKTRGPRSASHLQGYHDPASVPRVHASLFPENTPPVVDWEDPQGPVPPELPYPSFLKNNGSLMQTPVTGRLPAPPFGSSGRIEIFRCTGSQKGLGSQVQRYQPAPDSGLCSLQYFFRSPQFPFVR